MDINYFLLLKGKYTSMLSNIEELIETCETISEFNHEFITNTERGIYIIFNSDAHKQTFLDRKKQIQHLKNMCNQYIHSLCEHDFITDVIDIDPDRSKTISYCRLCDLCEDALHRL